MSLEYRSLENVPVHDVHQCFLEAFADYAVDISMSETAFQETNEVRAVDFGLSVGAFDEERLVGFTLNGVGQWNGQRTAYDAGTGVIPSYRGRGISKSIMHHTFKILRAQGVTSYLLEVLTSNTKALNLYKSLGFRITRRLECLVLKHAQFSAPRTNFSIVDVTPEQIPRLEGAWTQEPDLGFQASWQNAWSAIKRRPDLYRMIACFEEGACVGYGIIAAGRGGIAQLWVKSQKRRQGLGSQLLRELILRSPGQRSFAWVNVDADAAATLSFLKALGFTDQLSQYEMQNDGLSSPV